MTKKPDLESRGIIFGFFHIPFKFSVLLPELNGIFSACSSPNTFLLSCCFRRTNLCTVPIQRCPTPIHKISTKTATKIIFFNTKLLFFFIPHGPTTRKYWFLKLAAKMVKLHVVHTILCNFNPSGFVFYCWHKIQPLFCIASRPTFYFQVNQGLLWL